jgi:hypothetical protein
VIAHLVQIESLIARIMAEHAIEVGLIQGGEFVHLTGLNSLYGRGWASGQLD